MKKPSIDSIRFLGDITGIGHTDRWDVCGTDLGIPVYSPSTQRMYLLFGDTFGLPKEIRYDTNKVAVNDTAHARNWRGTVAGYFTDFDVSDGIKWEGFVADEEGNARALIDALYDTNENSKEVTKICQGGIEVNGSLYCFYESIRHWGPAGSGYWDVSYSGTIKSTDGGKTFQRVYDMTWAQTDQGEHAATIKEIIEYDMNNQPSGIDFDLSSHVAPGFGQMFACDGKDGYIYIFGRHGGRIHGIKVGRVKKEQIETFAQYEYLTGFENDAPVWVKGKAGLDILLKKGAACDIIPAPTSNMAVSYNSYLGKWILTYFKPGIGIMYALSDTPYGPYGDIEVMLDIDHPRLIEDNPTGGNRLYGGFSHELLNGENGKKFMLIISQWHEKFYNSKLVEITFA